MTINTTNAVANAGASRRNLLRAAFSLPLMPAMLHTPAISAATASAANIFVESEFAPLRTVVLAQSEVAISKAMLNGQEMAFIPEELRKNLPVGRDFGEAQPELQRIWEQERENFGAVLKKYGVEVLRPRKLTAVEKAVAGDDGYSNFFVRDPFFTVGNFVVEGSLRFLHRRNEVLPVRPVFEERVYPAECSYIALPRPEVGTEANLGTGPFLEGGDVLVLGNHVFVGSSGLASNPRGAQWLAKLLKPAGYAVELVRLKPEILHLDCALGLIQPGLMVVCEEALLDGIPDTLKSWKKIPVSMQEAGNLATNGLPLSPDVYVADPAFQHIGDQLERHGVKVEYVDFRISRSFGGSFRCSTQPLLRRS
ncbi:arginine deiminase family protein [Comamonas humi]